MKGFICKTILLVAFSFVFIIYPKAQQTAEKFIQETHYLLYLPQGYATDTAKSWPLLLFLHGSGESGDDLAKVEVHGPPKLIKEGRQFPFIVVSPQTHREIGWQPDLLKEMLSDIKKKYRVDNDRVYLTGLSMGGFGTWSLAEKYPEEFAAIVPICGGGDTARIWRLRYMPVWCFHGAKDNTVPIASSRVMVDALKINNPGVTFTIYPDAGHDSWTATYNNDSLYTWLLAQKKFTFKEVPVSQAILKEYAGTYIGPRNDTVRIEAGNGRLIAKPGHQSIELKANADTSFYQHENSLNHIEFFRDKKRQTAGFVLFNEEKMRFIRQQLPY
jgi:predicted esterase